MEKRILKIRNENKRKCKDVEYVIDENDCWIVNNLSKDKDGYALFKRLIDGKIFRRIHRAVYYLYVDNNLRDNEVVRHECNNPSCINPKHLDKGSHLENMQDRMLSNNYHGDILGTSKLNSKVVKDIVSLIDEGKSYKEISLLYKVDENTIYDIDRGKTWSYVTERNKYSPKSDKQHVFLIPNKNNISGVRGVFWDKQRSKWKSIIYINNKVIQLGYFDDFEKAVEVRRIAENNKLKNLNNEKT